MTFAERFRQIADMFGREEDANFESAFDSAIDAMEGHPEEDILFQCLIEATVGKTEIYWGLTTFIPETIKNEGFWVRIEKREKGSYTNLSFDIPPENSTTTEPTA